MKPGFLSGIKESSVHRMPITVSGGRIEIPLLQGIPPLDHAEAIRKML
jgi:hypothetical protein